MMSSHESTHPRKLHILLADDDTDDCILFRDALDQLPVFTKFSTVPDGEQLMLLLNKKEYTLPDVLFLDLNMPRKNGFACLEEVKRDKRLQHLPVIIFSTSYAMDIADVLYKGGAHYYICKPRTFSELKDVVQRALTLISEDPLTRPHRGNFLLSNPTTIMV